MDTNGNLAAAAKTKMQQMAPRPEVLGGNSDRKKFKDLIGPGPYGPDTRRDPVTPKPVKDEAFFKNKVSNNPNFNMRSAAQQKLRATRRMNNRQATKIENSDKVV